MHRDKKLEALAMIFGALGTGATIVLYALGETKAAAAIGVTGLLVGTTIGAARLIGDVDEDPPTSAGGVAGFIG